MKTKFNKVEIDRLGKFKVDSNNRREVLNLVGYLIPPVFQDDGRVVIDNERLIGVLIVYTEDNKPYIGLSEDEEEIKGSRYSYLNKLSQQDIITINSYKNYISKKDIEDFIQEELTGATNYIKTRIKETYKKWPQRDKCLETLKEIENNIDQTYVLKTEFYGD